MAHDPRTLTPAQIRAWLAEHGLSLVWLARETGLSYGYLRNVMTDQDRFTLRVAVLVTEVMDNPGSHNP